MYRLSKCLILVVFASSTFLWMANASEITIGSPLSAGNCLPFSCQGSFEYQQVYSNSAFLAYGSSDLTAVTFYVDPSGLQSGSHSLTTPTFSISLSTTSKSVGALDLSFANNIGANNTTVFSGTFSVTNATPGESIPLSFTTPFLYDPTLGNLLLTITSSTGFTTQNSGAGSLYLESEFPSTLSSRLTSTVYGTAQDNSALVTTFSTTGQPAPGPIAGVGMPGLVVFIGSGILVWWRRKRNATALAA
jgi:hypothetical protein